MSALSLCRMELSVDQSMPRTVELKGKTGEGRVVQCQPGVQVRQLIPSQLVPVLRAAELQMSVGACAWCTVSERGQFVGKGHFACKVPKWSSGAAASSITSSAGHQLQGALADVRTGIDLRQHSREPGAAATPAPYLCPVHRCTRW